MSIQTALNWKAITSVSNETEDPTIGELRGNLRNTQINHNLQMRKMKLREIK